MSEIICGIDEAGRGPLAGPMVFAGVVLKKSIEGLTDSKKLSEKKREALFDKILENSYHHIVFSDHNKIDIKGISACIRESLLEIILKLEADRYIFDGNSSYGIVKINHQIKADIDVAEVSAASILAKVSRDRYMDEISSIYKKYMFDKHKGYGTKQHIELIKQYGRCEIHRKSFKVKGLGEGEQATLF